MDIDEGHMDIEEGPMNIEAWQGLTMRTREGQAVGIVVGVFESGLLAGRLRVHGVYTPTAPKMGPLVGTAVFAIPRRAVVRRDHDSLILNTTPHAVQARWLMHVALKKGA